MFRPRGYEGREGRPRHLSSRRTRTWSVRTLNVFAGSNSFSFLLDIAFHIGKTKPLPDAAPGSDADLSIETLTSDLVNLLEKVYPDPAEAPSLVVSVQICFGREVAESGDRCVYI